MRGRNVGFVCTKVVKGGVKAVTLSLQVMKMSSLTSGITRLYKKGSSFETGCLTFGSESEGSGDLYGCCFTRPGVFEYEYCVVYALLFLSLNCPCD